MTFQALVDYLIRISVFILQVDYFVLSNYYHLIIIIYKQISLEVTIAQSAGAVEYTDCFSAEGLDPPNECPGYDTKQSDGEVPAMLELWGMRSTPSLPSLPGPLGPGVVAPDKGPIYGLNRTKPCFFHYTDFCI